MDMTDSNSWLFLATVGLVIVTTFYAIATWRMNKATYRQTKYSEFTSVLNTYAAFSQELTECLNAKNYMFEKMTSECHDIFKELYALTFNPPDSLNQEIIEKHRSFLVEKWDSILQALQAETWCTEIDKNIEAMSHNVDLAGKKLQNLSSIMYSQDNNPQPRMKELLDFHARLKWLFTGKYK